MPKVVVVGGGFCGLVAAKRLLRKGFEVVLVDPKADFEFTPSVYKAIFNPAYGRKITIPYSGALPGAGIVKGLATGIAGSSVLVASRKIHFDFAILCAGGSTPVPGFKGVFVIKRLADISRLRERLAKVDDAVICGGGQVGIELSADLARHGKKVTVLHAADRLIERSPEKAGRLAEARLRKLGVEVCLKEKVVKIENGTVITEHRRLRSSCIFWCIGIRPATGFLKAAGLLQDSRLHVNDFLQTSRSTVFAGGDIAEAGVEKTAQNAANQGSVIAENIIRLSGNLPLRKYRRRPTPLVIDLAGCGMFVWGSFVVASPLLSPLKLLVEVKEMFALRH